MATKEIRLKIKSIQSTRQITKAMEMVAASKMRRAQEQMQASRPYAENIQQVIAHLAAASLAESHRYLTPRAVKRVGVIVITSDRGLCGGMNINLLKKIALFLREQQLQGRGISLSLLGRKAEQFFKQTGGPVECSVTGLGDKPSMRDLIGPVKVMLDAFDAGEIDELHLAYNRFVNTMTQAPQVEQLIPVPPKQIPNKKHHWDYLYEPSAPALLNTLLIRYLESLVYQGAVENLACEQAARMIAMKNASDNAGDIIAELKLMYNKARQAAITQELSEIVAGAGAV